jgi:YesN/AraC family two-component response regulator
LRRILIVDPDPAVFEGLARLYGTRYALTRAETLEQGLALVHQGHPGGGELPALVVLEHRLPDGIGLDLLRRIKTTRPQLPVVMVTAHGSEAVCAAALKLGVRDYFIRPCDIHGVASSIEGILAACQAASERRRSALASGVVRLQAATEAARLELQAFRLRRVVELIQDQYWDSLSLRAVAHEVGLGYFTLSRRFTQAMGITFRRYLLQFRITKAQDLLARSNRTVTDISQMVGFSDLPRFDKAFRELVGTSPSAYRVSQTASRSQVIPDPGLPGQLSLPPSRVRPAAPFSLRDPGRDGHAGSPPPRRASQNGAMGSTARGS